MKKLSLLGKTLASVLLGIIITISSMYLKGATYRIAWLLLAIIIASALGMFIVWDK